MATGDSADTLETWLNKVTDPKNTSERWDYIQRFCQQVNVQPDGPHVATRLLAHKIKSPQEREALQALTLLEMCMNNCGKRFHSEATKFRFLNELIKVLSPKHLGTWSPALVKLRVTEVLYGWTLWMKDELKVQEAYRMLKKQGIVKTDPKLPDSVLPPCPRQEVSVFDDEDKSQLLSRLLKSSRPEDLQTANRLIKSTLNEEQEKMEKKSRCVSTLEEVEKCTTQLASLLSLQHTQHTQEEKDLYERCDRLRPILFRMASDTMNDDKALAVILQGNDKVTDVMNLYRAKTQDQDPETQTELLQNHNKQETASPIKTYHLIDFSVLGDSTPAGHTEDSSSLLLLKEDVCPFVTEPSNPRALGVTSYLDELTQLEDKTKDMREAGTMGINGKGDYNNHNASVLPVKEGKPFTSALGDMQTQPVSSEYKPHLPSSLMNVTVSLDSIKTSPLQPITVFDCHGIRVSFHFTKEAPPSRPDVVVNVISTVNTSALPVSDFMFLAAVPKTMQVRLQPATRTDLPAYNPILPPAAISQVLLLSNPLKKPVRVRFRLSMMLGENRVHQEAEIDEFPEWNSWINP